MSYDKTLPAIEELGFLLAEASRNVVFAIGAGMSMPAGLPGWVKLNEVLLNEAISTIKHDSTIDDKTKQERAAKLSSIKDPWLLGDALAKTIPRDRHTGIVRKELTASLPPPETYKAIWNLKPSGVLSFNLDSLAESTLGGTSEQTATALAPNARWYR